VGATMLSDVLSRCPTPGCPFRWTRGPDRPCADHRDGLAVIVQDGRAELWKSVIEAAPAGGKDRPGRDLTKGQRAMIAAQAVIDPITGREAAPRARTRRPTVDVVETL
jgi:hypothetical protein